MKKIFLFPRPPLSPPKLKRKPMGNTLGTCWNKGKMKKIFLFPPSPPKLKRKKQDTLSAG
jgi:hypothetical protein